MRARRTAIITTTITTRTRTTIRTSIAARTGRTTRSTRATDTTTARTRRTPGAIRAAQKTGAVIVPVAGQSTRRWSFKNWDIFYLTKPFAKTHLQFGEPLYFSKDDSYEDCSMRLKKSLDELENKVNENVGLVKDN